MSTATISSAATRTISLTIDGRSVSVPAGSTVFQAAEAAGIHIPHLCHHPWLAPSGACRLCVVEITGGKGLPTACTTPVAEGMTVQTETPRVTEARRLILELMLANHPLDCLTCEKCGDCDLQRYAYHYGVARSPFEGERREYRPDDSNPFFIRYHDKCILCGRCIRVCDEVMAVHAIDYARRGFTTKVSTAYDVGLEESPCVFCGNCVAVCPTGALQPRLSVGQGRRWEIRKVRTVCPYCGVGCTLDLEVRDEPGGSRVVGVSGGDGATNRGMLCVKGRFGWDFLHSPDRLTKPLIREGDGFREASWEEALELVAHRLGEIREKHGPDSLAALASARCTNEENYLLQKLVRAGWGTNNVDHCARLCHASSVVGLGMAYGSGAMTNSMADLEQATLFFVIGSNTSEGHPVLSLRVKKALARGAKLIVADPRRTELAERADIFLQHLPGTDVALLGTMMHVILAENLADEAFIAERTEGSEELRASLQTFTPEYGELVTGVPAELIVEAARAYATAERAAVLYAMGITQHTTGTDNVLAVASLAAICGQVGREGTGVNPLRGQNNVQGACDMGGLPNVLPGYQSWRDPAVKERYQAAWGRPLPEDEGLTVVEMMQAAGKGRIRGMYIMGENPMLSDPDLGHVEEALRSLDFLVVQDIFLTETVRLAHVVLPAAAFAEKEGTFTNTERRVQRLHQAIAPPGEARPDWQIICEVATRMGCPMYYQGPAQIMEEIASLVPSYGGMGYEYLGKDGKPWPCPRPDHPGTPILHRERFARGKARLFPLEFRPPAELPDEDYPLYLTTGRILFHYHTGSMTRRARGLQAIRPHPYVEIHPETAARLGVTDGQTVEVASRRGSIRLPALVTERTAPGVVFIPFHYAEAAANVLTNAALDPKAKIPEFKVCAVRLRPSDSIATGEPGGEEVGR